MILTTTLPDSIASRSFALPQEDRDSEIAEALELKWRIEQNANTGCNDAERNAWDAQIKADLAAGKLDFLLAEVDTEISAGRIIDAPRYRPTFLETETKCAMVSQSV